MGKCADLVAVDLSALESSPVFEPLSALLYTNSRHVSHVWLDGRTVVQDGKVLTLNIDMNATAGKR